MKKIIMLGLAMLCVSYLSAQQITRFAVVDLAKVIASYPAESNDLKNFQARKGQIQAEINQRSDEIRKLQAQKIDYDRAGDKANSVATATAIDAKIKELKEFVRIGQGELEQLQRKITAHEGDFTARLYSQIQAVAEAQGYSLVFYINSGDSVTSEIAWVSPQIDITNDVIIALSGKDPNKR